MVKLLKNNGTANFSIFLNEETNILFAYQEQKGNNSLQDLGSIEIVKKWWKYMADIMEINPDNSPASIRWDRSFI
jgi:L-rhamnose mutarotase